jgi:hypothetical protein
MSNEWKKEFLTHHLLLITHHFFLPSADEVDNLDAVSLGKFRVRPVGAAHDFAITFNGQARGHERELSDEVVERRAVLNLAAFAVDFDAQGIQTSTWKGE